MSEESSPAITQPKPTGRQKELQNREDAKAKLERKRAQATKIRAILDQKKAHKRIVMEKIEANMPITDAERELCAWAPGRKKHSLSPMDRDKGLIAAASKLLIQPTHVKELRMLVEQTAAKHKYNPIDALIQLTQGDSIEDSDKISIHKALLPFLVPVLSVPKATAQEEDVEKKPRVVINQFVFPEDSKKKIHEIVPTTVATTNAEPTAQPSTAP